MPKIKTNRCAYKKFRVGGTGTIKRKKANKSHLTAKMRRKRNRQLRQHALVDSANLNQVQRLLPYC